MQKEKIAAGHIDLPDRDLPEKLTGKAERKS